jgi:hypothetical protein
VITRRIMLTTAGCAVIWPMTSALTTASLTPAQQAIAAHYTNNDPNWAILRRAVVGEDRAKGLLTAEFPPQIKALAGQPFRISGFMSPLESSNQTRHFIVTRRSTTCPFCPPNEPTEAVEVRLTAPARFTDAEVMIAGQLQLVSSSDEGLFYVLNDAVLLTTRKS